MQFNDNLHPYNNQIQSTGVSSGNRKTSFNQIWNTKHMKTIESTIQTLEKDKYK